MSNLRWSKEEIEFLMKKYENSKNDEICNGLPLRNWESIKLKASQMKLKRYYNEKRLANLNVLLEDTNEIYYWIGFIMADGSISDKYRLRIKLSEKDKKHLEKFKKLVKYNEDLTNSITDDHKLIEICIMDTKYLKMLCKKFDIKHDKTYSPCNISKIKNKNLLFSLIIGFIDGDGCIRKNNNRNDFNLIVNNHKSWFNNLDYMLKSIYNEFNEKCDIEVKCEKYANFTISKTTILKKLKEKILQLNLPYLERKWNIIDLNYMTFYEKSKNDRKKFLNLIGKNTNISNSELCKKLNLNINTIYKYKRLMKENKLL